MILLISSMELSMDTENSLNTPPSILLRILGELQQSNSRQISKLDKAAVSLPERRTLCSS